MRRYYQIDGHPELLRDAHSKGLILTDQSVLKRDRAKRQSKQEMENLKNDVQVLKDKIEEVGDTLRMILAAIQKET